MSGVALGLSMQEKAVAKKVQQMLITKPRTGHGWCTPPHHHPAHSLDVNSGFSHFSSQHVFSSFSPRLTTHILQRNLEDDERCRIASPSTAGGTTHVL